MIATAATPSGTTRTGRPSARPNLPSLTGLRWFAALAVFTVHAGIVEPQWLVVAIGSGTLGVSFFFILSGFVMAWSATDGDTPSRFYLRRFARIYPVYFVTWALAVVLALIDSFPFDPRVALVALPMLQSWHPSAAVFFGYNGPAWSLSTEAFFYLLFPLALRLLTPRSNRALVVAGGVSLGLMTAVGVTALNLSTTAGIDSAQGTWAWLAYIFPPTRFLEFLIGCVVALLVRRSVRLGVPLWFAVALVLVVGVALPRWINPRVSGWVCVIPFVLLIVAAAERDISGRGSWFGRPWLVRLGQWSFAFYLVHTEVIHIVNLVRDHVGIPTALDRFAILAPTELVLSTAVAAALHYGIERPMERRIRARAVPSRPLPVSS